MAPPHIRATSVADPVPEERQQAVDRVDFGVAQPLDDFH